MEIRLIKENTEIVENEFGGLNNIQMNWKPDENTWSIAQVIEHVIVSNRKYLEVLQKACTKSYKPTFWEKRNPLSKYTGRSMVKNLGDVVSKKYTAPMLFRPSKGMISQDVITHFIKMQEEMHTLFSQIVKEGYLNRVITSPVANLVTLTVGDTIDLIIGHELRHIKQALKIKSHKNFPR